MQKKSNEIKIEVSAYSGYKINEQPLYFVLGLQKIEIRGILDRWYGQEHDYFKVLAENGKAYIIKWHRSLDAWFLVKTVDEI